MIQTSDIRKLSDFRQNATAHLDRLEETGSVEVLTVNGEAKGVVMSASTFDKIAEAARQMEITESIRKGMDEIAAGQGIELNQAMKEIAADNGLEFKE